MKRRTVLQGAGVGAAVALAGCLDGVQEHFGLAGTVPIEITNEGSTSHSVLLQAQERGSGRESYDQSLTVSPPERAAPPHLSRTDQQFRVSLIQDDQAVAVATAEITTDSQFVRIWLYDDDVEIEVRERGDDTTDPD